MQRLIKYFAIFIPTGKRLKPAMLAFFLGAILVAGFAPISFAPVVLISLAGLFYLWNQAETSVDSTTIGLWFGLGQFGFGVSWLVSSMYVYSNMALPLAMLATFFFVLFLSLFVAFAGWLVYFFRQNSQAMQFAILMPLIWVFVEWIRSIFFGGFPFLLVGTTHIDTWLDGYAPVFGVHAVSWAVAASAGILVWLYLNRNWLPASLAFSIIWLFGASFKSIEWVTPVGEPVEVALIQGNISQDKKWQAQEFLPSMQTYVSLTKQSIGAEVIVWPETAVPQYFDVVERGALHSFIKDAQLLNTDILMGVIYRSEDKKHYYNAVVNAHDPKQVYLKHHLVPFSEFFPFPSFFEFLAKYYDMPFSSFAAGEYPQPLMTLGEHQVGLSVCYEMSFGSELAETAADAKYLITVSNDAWFANTLEPAQQLQEVQMRALELGREIARSTNTGYTAVVGVDGLIKTQLEPYETAALKTKVQPYEGSTPFVFWKNIPMILLFSILFSFLIARKWLMQKMFNRAVKSSIKQFGSSDSSQK